MILEIRKKINDEMQTIKVIGGNFIFVFNEERKRIFVQIDPNDTFNLPCKNIEYSVHGNIVFAETE
jgi:hypothetical protein